MIVIPLTRPANAFRMSVTVSPLLPREIKPVIGLYSHYWTKPEDISESKSGDGIVLQLTADDVFPDGSQPDVLVKTLSFEIWKKLGRYVKITVDFTDLGEPPQTCFELGQEAYAEAFSARFEH